MSSAATFVTAMVCFFVGVGFATWISYESHSSHLHESKPYALKQNGDTLFIPTQVIIKHDTLVVIQTSERRPVQDSIYEITGWSTGGTIVSGGWSVQTEERPKIYKSRDTIYEHKIIYY